MNVDQMDVAALCQCIWEVEYKYDLLDFNVGGVKVWQYMRMPIYYYVAEQAGLFLAPHVQKNTTISKLAKICKYLFGALFHNPFLRRGPVEQVVIEHPRSMKLAGEEVDIYSHFYVRELKRKGIPYLSLDRADLSSSHRKAYDSERSFIDIFPVLVKLIGLFSRPCLTEQQRATLQAVSERLSRQVGVSLDLEALLASAVPKFKINKRLYQALFKRLKPKRLVVVVSYAYGDAICAAKELGIETLEIQHGTFSRYHLGYSYPDTKSGLDYFPDAFMAWGSFWRDMGVLPLPSEAIQVVGFPYFIGLKDRYAHIKKNDKRVVVLSQGALGAKIAEQVYALRDVLSDYDIIYKLHPGEFARWQDYEPLCKLAEQPNVRIAKEDNLYELLAGAGYQIGVFSTAVYEGIGFGCRTLLLDLPGVEYMTDLVEQGLASMVRNEDDLLKALGEAGDPEASFDPGAVFGCDASVRP
ncbi:hypothetical protein Q8A57_08635 [Porticoccus litoralis]|uniref:Capsule biosynthesis protein n=1 Tax=Porticoccus litoralis TaxID=434086 RepID=A0AAW8B376_9GAMM|nr:hypothetical protein [Porticoccus litoralis]MDP1521031.1 hypothetical protein [Porticoccus litoralis]